MEFKLIELAFQNPDNPHREPGYKARTRGHIYYDIERWECEFCGTCAKNCPAQAIHVDDEAFVWSIDRFSCVQCGCCIKSCLDKTRSTSMKPEFTPFARAKYVDEFVAPEEDDDDDFMI